MNYLEVTKVLKVILVSKSTYSFNVINIGTYTIIPYNMQCNQIQGNNKVFMQRAP